MRAGSLQAIDKCCAVKQCITHHVSLVTDHFLVQFLPALLSTRVASRFSQNSAVQYSSVTSQGHLTCCCCCCFFPCSILGGDQFVSLTQSSSTAMSLTPSLSFMCSILSSPGGHWTLPGAPPCAAFRGEVSGDQREGRGACMASPNVEDESECERRGELAVPPRPPLL